MTPPTGSVTFLFTDVEGSTRLWESDPAGMTTAIAHHDSLVREAAAAHGGHVFSTAGDGFGVAFPSPPAAVAAALAIQLGLTESDWSGPALKVRMGIHSGWAEERGGDYFGPAVNRAARIMAAGNGGQILLSAVTAHALFAIEPAFLDDLGVHRLKDLAEPEHLYELRHPSLPAVTAPVRTIGPNHNLPEYLSSFVGREVELAELGELVDRHRLVVLTGVGGTGKTRLAVEAARRQVDRRPDGAWLVELTPVTDPAMIMTAVGAVWGLRPGDRSPIEEVVARYLADRDLLVVVDNCEHVLEGAVRAIRHLLQASPAVRVVATSRESLGIGETIVPVPSLDLPSDDEPEAAESTRLFMERARAVRPDFSPGPEEIATVARICLRIDGIPLGLELAAARLRSLSLSELADRLDDSFRILSGSAKTALPRQRTLQATIDWSHDLLTDAEKAVFARLSVFSGGFDLAAAEDVSSGDGILREDVVDLLDSLVDKSLVVATPTPDGSRYRLLEPVRQYAQEKLAATGAAPAAYAAHADHYARRASDAAPRLGGQGQIPTRRALDEDHANLLQALQTLSEAGDNERYLRMVFDLFLYWMQSGKQVEAIDTALAVLERDLGDVDPVVAVKAWWTTAFLGAEITRPASVDHARSGLDVARRLGDPRLIGKMELVLGAAIRHSTTDPDYLQHLEEARRLLAANPEPYWWDPEWEKGIVDFLLGAYMPASDPRTREHLEAAIATFESLGDEALLVASLSESFEDPDVDWARDNLLRALEITENLELPFWRGHAAAFLGALLTTHYASHESARRYWSEAIGYLRDCGDISCWASGHRYLAAIDAQLGLVDEARAHVRTVIDALPSLPMRELHVARLLDASTRVLLESGKVANSAMVLGLARSIDLSQAMGLSRTAIHDELRKEIATEIGEERTDQLIAAGAELTLDDGLELVLRSLD